MRIFKRHRYMLCAGLCVFLVFASAQAYETEFTCVPERIVLTLTPGADNSQAVTWRTGKKVAFPRARIVKVSELLNSKSTPKTFPALTTEVELDKGTIVYHHSVVFNSLEPDVLYAYCVGHDSGWSEWNQFRTASKKSEAFTFLYFGDVQEQAHIMCSQVFRAAFQKEPDARFWLFAGDMVDNGPDDDQWEDFFAALGWIPRTLPLVLVPGNHEYPDRRFIPQEDYHITNLWRPHFTLPENGPRGLEETVFSFEYQNVCFVVLNGNEQIKEQARWLETILSKNEKPWIIVSIHQPVYSISKRRNPTEFQELFVPIFDRFSVDLILQGHDHGYARTFPLKNNQQVPDKKKGTVYVISNAGPKFYPVSSQYDHLMAKTGAQEMLFQSIRVDGKTLRFTAYTNSKEVYDTFEIHQ